MTRIEKLNCEQKKLVEELQLRMKNDVSPEMSRDDLVYYRFLKARDFDVHKAEKMLRKCISWRKTYQMDTILDDFKPKEVYSKHIEVTIFGYDKDGDPIAYVPAGKLDANDVLRCFTMNDFMMHITWNSEKILDYVLKENEKTGRDSEKCILIFDLDKLTVSNTISKLTAEIIFRLVHNTQDNLPETLKAIYVINAPTFFAFFFSMLKTWMATAIIQKTYVFSHNGWKEKLLENIGADVLPAFLGGNRTDPDGKPLCTTFIKHGGKVSPKYYLSDEDRYFKDMSKVRKVFVPPKEKREIPVEVTENNIMVQWKFLVHGKNIGFGLNFQSSDQDVEELLPVHKFSTPDGTENGSYKCQSIGKYVIIFDNSYSWMSSKEVRYSVNVTKDR